MPRLERLSLLAGTIAALRWTRAIVLLEASGYPVGPDSGELSDGSIAAPNAPRRRPRRGMTAAVTSTRT
jgi:hypothetical protein